MGGALAISLGRFAQNLPIIQTKYTADPIPMVYNDTVYLYTSHDEDNATGFLMKDWLLYKSVDMVNWTECGPVASLKNFRWATDVRGGQGGGFDNGAWASHVIERNGKFYMYCTVHKRGIGVLVSNTPYGPFKDPIGKPLVEGKHIDPAAFIDDDGQAYLYWGNPNLWYVKLNKDMISVDGKPRHDPSMEKKRGKKDPFFYQEGPWAYKRNGKYYMTYASKCCPEGIGYAMSNSPLGPWKFAGYIMEGDERSSGNHPGIIDFKGKTYVFGFNYTILRQTMAEKYERRSVSVAEMKFNNDGTIVKLPFWEDQKNGVEQIGTFNPYRQVEAETMAYSEGLKSDITSIWKRDPVTKKRKKIATFRFITSVHNGDFMMLKGVDFAKGCSEMDFRVAPLSKSIVEIRIDKKNGPLIGTLKLNRSGEGDVWRTVTTKVKRTTGVHDLYFVFKGEKELLNFDWWYLKKK